MKISPNYLCNAGLVGMQPLPHAWLVSDFGSNWISVDLLQNYPGSSECHLQSGLHLKLQSIACRGKATAGVADLTPHNPAQVLATWESTCDEIPSKVVRRKDRAHLLGAGLGKQGL